MEQGARSESDFLSFLINVLVVDNKKGRFLPALFICLF